MASGIHDLDSGPADASDLNKIFIGRETQLEQFEFKLERWQQLLRAPRTNGQEEGVSVAPSPTNKLRCFVTMLFGRGGFGKSTLLRHYRTIAINEHYHYSVCEIIDWEFAVEGRRGIFHPGPQQYIEPRAYYNILCEQLAATLDKKPHDFREYQAAVSAVEQAYKEAHSTLERLRTDDRYKWLRDLSIEGINTALNTLLPGSGMVLAMPVVKTAEGAAAKLTQEGFGQLVTHLRDRLKHPDNFFVPELRLGLALGRDLARFARNAPLLFFFDTYEEIDEGDTLLRIVMAAAGLRVGWVIAGRDNLWGGHDQRERSLALEYGYKDLVPPDRGLAINFNAQDIGAFGLGDIIYYFQQLTHLVQQQQVLPELTEAEAKRVLDVTQGIPLAVNIAAELYRDTGTLDAVTEEVEGQREIIERMVHRYLLHARDDQQQRAQLYGLALLRRADQPHAVAAALGLTPEQAQQQYQHTLTQLHRRYSFIFTEKAVPALHQEVRHFLRIWLLEHHMQPEIATVNERIITAQEAALHRLEEQRHYTSLGERLQDNSWINTYLDLAEQQYWHDLVSGIHTILPFMFAAAIYRSTANQDAAAVGEFFTPHLSHPYRDWWLWATAGLPGTTASEDTDVGERKLWLLALGRLAEQRNLSFPPLIPDFRKELEAAVWWSLGNAYRDDIHEYDDEKKALVWYERALTKLEQNTALRKDAVAMHARIAEDLADDTRYAEAIVHFTKALTLDPDYATFVYMNRGNAYFKLKDYHRAIADYDQAISLNPNDETAYMWRGSAYFKLKDYHRAIANYNQAISFYPLNAHFYNNRGGTYNELKDYHRAVADYDQAISLYPLNAHFYNNRGGAYTELKDYHRAVADYDQAISLNPNNETFYRGRGRACLFLKDTQQAIADLRHACKLYQDDLDAAWTVMWIDMGKKQPNTEFIEHLEAIASSEAQNEYDVQRYVVLICKGVSLGWHGKLKEGLLTFEQAIRLLPEYYDGYFWKGLLSAYYYRGQRHEQEAMEAIGLALQHDMPPILLRPLYWLERDRPAFFAYYARLLLERYEV